MISVTLGTISYPFDRAVRWIKICLDKDMVTEPIFIQHGSTDVSSIIDHPLVTAKPIVSVDEWLDLVFNSSLVISHAGQGSTRMLAEKNARFFLLPRLAIYGEHVDDHQIMFAKSIKPTGITYCITIEEFQTMIASPPLPFKGNIFEGPRLAEFLLIKYPGKV